MHSIEELEAPSSNRMPKKKRIIVFYIVAIVISTLWISYRTKTELKDETIDEGRCLSFPNDNFIKPFVYLIQTESCLYDYLKSLEVIGNTTACQCDALVLSYKDKCTDTSLPHVQYTFDPSTTWTTGRNLLYKTVMERGHRYLYYTFMDDDVVLKFSDSERTSGNPWREFEASVLREQPAVAVAHWNMSAQILQMRRDKGCRYSETSEFIPFIWYDALYDSFHYRVINHLLPYYSELDGVSWWNSQLHLLIKTTVMFYGQVMHTSIMALNPIHRDYPREEDYSKSMAKLVQNVQHKIPIKYRKFSELGGKFQYDVSCGDILLSSLTASVSCNHSVRCS